MTRRITFQIRLFAAALALLLGSLGILRTTAAPADILPPGFRPVPVGVHALVGARVVVKPGEPLDSDTIIIRDGYIEKVGKDGTPPADARVWDVKGLTIYAGFIDPYLSFETKDHGGKGGKKDLDLTAGGVNFFGVTHAEPEAGAEGPGYEVARVTPQHRAAQSFAPDTNSLAELRELGFTVANVTADKGIFRGPSAVVSLADTEPNRAIIRPDVFQHVAFDLEDHDEDIYPASLMGVVAVVRQTFLDAQFYAQDHADYAKHPSGRARPAFNPALEALGPAFEKKMTVLFEPLDALMVDRAARVAHEMGLDFYMVSCGQEWRRPDLAKAVGVPFIVPLNFPRLPKLPDEGDWEQVTLDELRAWDWAPENAAVLRRQGLEVALTTHGLSDKKDFRKNLRLAVDRGLSETDALAALTTVPARLCGVDNLLGTVEAGKQANLTLVEGKGYFDPEAKVTAVWIDGKFYRVPGDEGDKSSKEASDGGAKETTPKTTPTEAGEPAKPRPESEATKSEAPKTAAAVAKSPEDKKQSEKEKKLAKKKELQQRVARAPLEGRGVLAAPPAVLVRNATIWTCGPEGRIEHADLLVEGGKVRKVGTGIAAPKNALVIEGE